MAFEFIWNESTGTLNKRAQFSTVTPQQRKGWQEVGACPWSGASLAVISAYYLKARQAPLS